MDAESGSLNHGESKNMAADKVCTQSNTVRHRFLFPTKQVPRPTKRAQTAASAWSNNSRFIVRQLAFTAEKTLLGSSMYSHKTNTEDRDCNRLSG